MMKKFTMTFLAGVMFMTSNIYAQTVMDIYNQNQKQREDNWKKRDDRGVSVGFYGQYFLYPSAQINGNSAFVAGLGGGLKIYIPSFTSGDGTLGGDNTGDFTISLGYTNWTGGSDSNFNDLPDWNV
jgi:hypothetical protein